MPFCMPITCNRQVDSLDRRQNNLTEVPHDIERFRALEELLLSMNQIKTMPKGLFRLHKLRFLDMSDNDINLIPPEIQNLNNLVELRLRNNGITDVPEQLAHCKSLMVFDLSSNPITRLPESISQCSQLTHLGLNDVSLTQLPADIGQLVNLRSLEVRENLIRAVPPSITLLSKLQMIDLGDNEIDVLPTDIGNMEALRELYIDNNDIETLPDQITRCRRLEQLDVSENKLACLPDDFGSLDQLTDINLSQNFLQILPHSIGRLKKLVNLKLERNTLTQLTPSIGSCDQLAELFLSENLLNEIPASIGNLKHLTYLNVDKNNLSSLPPEIGLCSSLSILSVRENRIAELPIEIGKCSEMSILDLCSNQLNHLPFTINVLFKLRALWLSENQVQAMMKLQVARDPRTGNKVLTCYLLPQQGVVSNDDMLDKRAGGGSGAFLGGPKVHFPDQDATIDEEKLPTGQFERHDTPKPKAHKDKFKDHKKNSIDGHVIPHAPQHIEGATLALSKRGTPETSPQGPIPTPRSALKFQSIPPTQYEGEMTPNASRSQLSLAPTAQLNSSSSQLNKTEKATSPNGKESSVVRRISIRRDEKGGLGLSIAGGHGSTPYKENDPGLFISRVNPGGPADKSGLRVGDKLMRVNSTDVSDVEHTVAVEAMQRARDMVELTIMRMEEVVAQPPMKTPDQSLDISFMSDANEMSSLTREMITATLKRDSLGSPGFAVAGGVGSGRDGIVISSISPGGPADRHGKLAVGDHVILINGTKMRGVRHDQAVSLLTGSPNEDVHLVVQRDRPSITSPLPSTPIITSGPPTANTTAQSPPPVGVSPIVRSPSASVPVSQLGDTSSWDGKTEEVELHRDGKSLGLSIVGGSDHMSHPFGILHPGVFISKIAANSPADRSHRLRIGDRILFVNNVDVRTAEHRTAVEALKSSGGVVRLKVTHEVQPSGLREVNIRRRTDQPLGISIHGGVGKPPANPNDKTDEGIFVDKVEPHSISEQCGLVAGHRLIEVNGESLLGASQQEAAQQLKAAADLRLLICDGYNAVAERRDADSRGQKTASTPSVYSSGVDENGLSSSVLSSQPSPLASPQPPPISNGIGLLNGVMEEPLATSSPLPSAIPKPSRIPPPVAPKPTLRLSQTQNVPLTTPETLPFNSKLKKFEHEIEVKRIESRQTSATNLPPPEKRSLLSEEDVKKLKEAESRKVVFPSTTASPEKDEDSFYDHLLDNDPFPRAPPSAIPIRTKKAENRAVAAGIISPSEQPLNDVERRAMEQQKRSEWRAARLKSLDQEREEADAIMQRLQLNPMMSSITEDGGSDRVLTNETNVKRTEHVDPVTGARSITVEENSITRRQIDLDISGGSELGFADE